MSTLKEELIDCLKRAGAFDVGITDPRVGFEHALPPLIPRTSGIDVEYIVVLAS
ncbi:MAG: hypothetical protein J7L11_10360 [Thermoprotei archaeon]|nr:hypothetical protein [Thermoprotei archaeon]